ncbi:MAG: dTDP-4-dehydrorhamnose reductase [Phycisphaerae bacterium]|nr:dTDP-4-dehydrorhamnose reductase [Phycisphaerae bacterium]
MGKHVVALLGGRGMLGTELAAACRRRGYEVRVHDLPEFDISDMEHLRKAANDADVIVNCAAYTNVDGAESQSQLAHRVNAEAVGRLGEVASKSGKWVLHFGTDFVFDGRLDRPYVETDEPNPISEYGRSKLAGERLLQASGCAHCIVRLEWTYGPNGNNFITKLIQRATANGAVSVVEDQVGAPTAVAEVAKIACRMMEGRITGLYHFASAGYASRYDVAAFVFDRLLRPVDLRPCRTSDYPSPAARPLNSRFHCGKIQAILDAPIAPWQEPLELYLRQLQ